MANYVGILDGGGNAFGVRIPDLPGCYGGGATPGAAIADAMSAAREWIAHREARNESAPKPSAMSRILKSQKLNAGQNEAAVNVNLAEL